MTIQTDKNEAQFKVRHNALLLEQFTPADIIRITGLNSSVVHTELEKMRQDNLLSSHIIGGDPLVRTDTSVIYQLTDDPEARLHLSNEIEHFYPTVSSSDRPTTRHYWHAKQLLDEALNVNDEERRNILDEADVYLSLATEIEQEFTSPQHSTLLQLEYEHARLLYLRGKYTEAEPVFQQLLSDFRRTGNTDLEKLVTEFLLCIRILRQSEWDEGHTFFADALLKMFDSARYKTDSPVTILLAQQLRDLSATVSNTIQATATHAIARGVRREITLGDIDEVTRLKRQPSKSKPVILEQSKRQRIVTVEFAAKPRPLRSTQAILKAVINYPPTLNKT